MREISRTVSFPLAGVTCCVRDPVQKPGALSSPNMIFLASSFLHCSSLLFFCLYITLYTHTHTHTHTHTTPPKMILLASSPLFVHSLRLHEYVTCVSLYIFAFVHSVCTHTHAPRTHTHTTHTHTHTHSARAHTTHPHVYVHIHTDKAVV